jgi:hypothetical protein
MKKISSGQTFFLKKIFPVIWLGVILSVLAPALMLGALEKAGPIILIGPIFMVGIGAIVYRKLIFDLADEVHDGGDFLKVRKGSEEETIPLANIMNVSATTMINPPRITLKLLKPGRFGDEVSFSPVKPFSFNAFARNGIAEDLIVRVDAARRLGRIPRN